VKQAAPTDARVVREERAALRLLLPALLIGACGTMPPIARDVDAGPAPRDAGPAVDAGAADAGAMDAGLPDAGVAEAGLVDAGDPADAGALDAGALDAGALDAGALDAGALDAGALDAGDADAGDADAGPPDAGLAVDAGPRPDFVIEGFGRFTRGGWQPGADEYVVTSLQDSGPGTLREGLDTATGPRLIRFALDGTIALGASLLVPSNVTVDGRGHAITLTGKGLILAGSDDVILINLAVQDVGPSSEDGLRIGDPTGGASERVVVDHCTFRATGGNGDSKNTDEAISVIFGSRDISLQWLRFENWEKVLLVGNGDAPQAVDGAITVSWHHSYARATGRRHPQVRYGTVDEWNLFLDDWRMFDWLFASHLPESFGAQSQQGARLRIESSLFKRTAHTKDVGSTANQATRCETNGALDGLGLVITPDSTAPLQFGAGCTGSTGWTRAYPATVDAADAALRLRLETQAGNTL
jgi:pectate lyase